MALEFKNNFVQKTNQSVCFIYKTPCINESFTNLKKPGGIFCLSMHSYIRREEFLMLGCFIGEENTNKKEP
jgi:hypothetical protein